ncbi:unnamed protein product [marine sediment metagenome]|uniref:Uncharacterized protein n=1 Tax=marine sediment metagenome TaxID=412755 RepID=X1HH32_9ZZZZ
MDPKQATNIAAVLGVIGFLFILAGPAFHFVTSEVGIFLALACWVSGGALKAYSKREKKEAEEKSKEKKK